MTRNTKEFVNHAGLNAVDQPEISKDHVCILLAHYNGAGRLGEQLESLAAQTHADWSLIISDDGSSDHWHEIAAGFAERHAVGRTWMTAGPGKGYAQNFLTLAIAAGPLAPYAAFCDQDDVWFDTKLERALKHLSTVPDGRPGLYCSRTVVCDENLVRKGPSPLFRKPPCFANALVQNIAGGNTMVLNRAALDLVQDTSRHAGHIVSHDWWMYQLVSGAGGEVIYDTEPSLLYCQHGGNAVGANASFRALLLRLTWLAKGRFRRWNGANVATLQRVRHWLTPEARETLARFAAARHGNLLARLSSLYRARVSRQTRRGTAALWMAAVFNRL